MQRNKILTISPTKYSTESELLCNNLDSWTALSHTPDVMISRYSKRIHEINRTNDSGYIHPDGRILLSDVMPWNEYMEDLKQSSRRMNKRVRYAKWKFKYLKYRVNLLYKARKDTKKFDE